MNNTNTKNINKIIKELFNKPTYKFHIRELARATKLNPNTIINLTDELLKEKLVILESKKHLTEITLNFENKKTIRKKRVFNLSNLYESRIVDFLIEKFSPLSISVIGSYSKGEDIEKSDIDIVIFVNKKEKEILDLREFEKKLNRTIHLSVIERKEISEEFFNNLINGIVLYGVIK